METFYPPGRPHVASLFACEIGQETRVDGACHCLVSPGARVEMVTAVELRSQAVRVARIAQRGVEIADPVSHTARANPVVDLIARRNWRDDDSRAPIQVAVLRVEEWSYYASTFCTPSRAAAGTSGGGFR